MPLEDFFLRFRQLHACNFGCSPPDADFKDTKLKINNTENPFGAGALAKRALAILTTKQVECQPKQQLLVASPATACQPPLRHHAPTTGPVQISSNMCKQPRPLDTEPRVAPSKPDCSSGAGIRHWDQGVRQADPGAQPLPLHHPPPIHEALALLHDAVRPRSSLHMQVHTAIWQLKQSDKAARTSAQIGSLFSSASGAPAQPRPLTHSALDLDPDPADLDRGLDLDLSSIGHAIEDVLRQSALCGHFGSTHGAGLQLRVQVRRVTEAGHYWAACKGASFLVLHSGPAPAEGSSGRASQPYQPQLIVEPGFRQGVTTPRMTERYRRFWDALPDVFIGQPSQLAKLLRLVAHELRINFSSLGRPLPPWRAHAALAAHWLPRRYEDIDLPPRALPAVAVPTGPAGSQLPGSRTQPHEGGVAATVGFALQHRVSGTTAVPKEDASGPLLQGSDQVGSLRR